MSVWFHYNSPGPVMMGGEVSGPVSTENLQNFPPPTPMYEVQTDGKAIVVMTNATSEPMRIVLKGNQEYVFTLAPCHECVDTNDEELAGKLCDRAITEALYVEPGTYQAFVGFAGMTENFKSQWELQPKWQYDQCIFTQMTW